MQGTSNGLPSTPVDVDLLQRNINLMRDVKMKIRRLQSKLDSSNAEMFITLAAQMLAPLRINCSPSDYMRLYSTSISGLTDVIFVFTELAKTLGPQPLYNSCQMVSPLVPRLYLLTCAASAYMHLIVPNVGTSASKGSSHNMRNSKTNSKAKLAPIQSNATTYMLFRDLIVQSASLCSFKGLFFRDFVFCVLHKYLDGLDIHTATKIMTDNFADNTVIAQRWLSENENRDAHSATSVHVIFQLLGNAISRIAGLEQLGTEGFNEIVLPQVTQQIILMRNCLKISPSNTPGSGLTNSGGPGSMGGGSGQLFSGSLKSGSGTTFNPQGFLLDCLIRSFPSSLLHSGIGTLFDTFVRVSDTPLVKLIGSLIIRLTEYMVGNENDDHMPSPSLFEFLCKQICSMCVLGLIPPSHALAVSKALLPMAVLIENNARAHSVSRCGQGVSESGCESSNTNTNTNTPPTTDVLTPWLNCLAEISKEIDNKRSEQRTLQGALYSYVQFIKNRSYKGPSLPVFSKIVLSLPEAMHSALSDTLLENVIGAEMSFPLESILPVIKLTNEPDKAAATLYRYSRDMGQWNNAKCRQMLLFFRRVIQETSDELKRHFSTTMICIIHECIRKLGKETTDTDVVVETEDGEKGTAETDVVLELKTFMDELYKLTPLALQLRIKYGEATGQEVVDCLLDNVFPEGKTNVDAFVELLANSRRNELFAFFLNNSSHDELRPVCEFLCLERDEGVGNDGVEKEEEKEKEEDEKECRKEKESNQHSCNKLIVFVARVDLLFKLYNPKTDQSGGSDPIDNSSDLSQQLIRLINSSAKSIEEEITAFLEKTKETTNRPMIKTRELLNAVLKDYKYVVELFK